MGEIVSGAFVVLLTAFLADKASEKHRKTLWITFCILVIGLAVLQWHNKKSQEIESLQQRKQITDLMGELQHSETSRQVDNAMLRTKLEDYSQFLQLGPALMKIAESGAEFQRKQYETKVSSDKEVYDLTMSAVKSIRDFSKKYSDLEAEVFSSGIEQTSDADRQRKWAERNDKLIQMTFAKQSEFQTSVLPDALQARNQLLDKRIREPQMDPMQKSEVNMAMHGALAGIQPELTLANYLEEMAKSLRHK
jgi:hypothetical protein